MTYIIITIIIIFLILVYNKPKIEDFTYEVEFYNENSIPCSTGIKLSGSVIIKGSASKYKDSQATLHTFIETMKAILIKNDHEWLYVKRDILTETFIEELKNKTEDIKVQSVAVNNLECASKEFYDPIKDAKGLVTMKAHQEEKDRKIAELIRQEEEQIAKNNAEAAAKIKALEEELAEAEAKMQEEIRQIEERATREKEKLEKTTTKKST